MRFKNFLKYFVISLAFLFSFGFVNVNAETLQSMIDGSTTGKVVLDQNFTEKVSVAKGKNMTIDLNGKTITGAIEVKGTLTIKDSKTGGAVIANTEKNASAIQVEGGKLILQSGTVKNGNGYGIYALEGGKVTVNGGTIDTLYAGLSGNNTTGDMYFTVNDGVVKAKYGPAVYVPGQVGLNVNGGTLNGGISLRMGTLNIKGGVITAVTGDIDSPSEYYAYNGCAWLPDAIYVMGGTYNSASGNDLSINITGGVITTSNRQGSALAIYDLGKVSQKMNVSISGSAKLITNSKTRTAYDILSLSDIGVTSPKAGFNNPSYVGKVSTSITGGTYSNINDKYIASGYDKNLVNGNYVVSKKVVKVDMPSVDLTKEVKDVTVGVTNYNVVKGVLLASLEKSNINTDNITPFVDVDVANKSASSVSGDVKNAMLDVVSSKAANAKIVSYFDISVLVKNAANGNVVGNLTKLTDKIKFTVAIPSDLTKVKTGMERNFYVIREHNGVATVLPTKLSKDGKSLTFETDKFSTYALAYSDVASSDVSNVKNPQTYDGIMGYVVVTLVALGGALGAVVYLKRNSLNN